MKKCFDRKKKFPHQNSLTFPDLSGLDKIIWGYTHRITYSVKSWHHIIRPTSIKVARPIIFHKWLGTVCGLQVSNCLSQDLQFTMTLLAASFEATLRPWKILRRILRVLYDALQGNVMSSHSEMRPLALRTFAVLSTIDANNSLKVHLLSISECRDN